MNTLSSRGEPSNADFTLRDDGTEDTVIELPCGHEARYSSDTAAQYRGRSGALDFDRFISEVVEEDGCGDCD